MPPFLHSPLSATEWGYTSQRPYGTAPLIEMGLRSFPGRRLPEKTSRSPGGIKRPHFSNQKDYRREIGNVKQDFRIDFWTRRSKGSPSPRREHSRQSPMSPVFCKCRGISSGFFKETESREGYRIVSCDNRSRLLPDIVAPPFWPSEKERSPRDFCALRARRIKSSLFIFGEGNAIFFDKLIGF